MNSRVLGLVDQDEWQAIVERLDGDVYHTPAYLGACAANGDGEPVAFVVEDRGEALLHPLLRRSIPAAGGEWWDGESAYGYAGPLASTAEPWFLGRAWARYEDWCAESGLVAEFVRFNPLLGNVRLAPPTAVVSVDRPTVALSLRGDEDSLWKAYPSTQRNMVRKALRAGLFGTPLELPAGEPSFRALYQRTMDRVGAPSWYGFSNAYFAELTSAATTRLFGVLAPDGALVAAGLFLVHGRRMHYHLAGSAETAGQVAATNLLVHTAATWGQRSGIEVLHLGGGRTPLADDTLLRFKRSISQRTLDYATGRVVHNDLVFDSLCSQWLVRTGARERPSYFLCYRLEEHV